MNVHLRKGDFDSFVAEKRQDMVSHIACDLDAGGLIEVHPKEKRELHGAVREVVEQHKRKIFYIQSIVNKS